MTLRAYFRQNHQVIVRGHDRKTSLDCKELSEFLRIRVRESSHVANEIIKRSRDPIPHRSHSTARLVALSDDIVCDGRSCGWCLGVCDLSCPRHGFDVCSLPNQCCSGLFGIFCCCCRSLFRVVVRPAGSLAQIHGAVNSSISLEFPVRSHHLKRAFLQKPPAEAAAEVVFISAVEILRELRSSC